RQLPLRLAPDESPLLALQRAQDLDFPPLLDALDRTRREVDWRPVLEPRAQERVYVRMGGPVGSAVLVDCEDALDVASRAAECLLDRVADGPLGGDAVQPREPLGGAVVDGQDEAKVDRPSQAPRVVGERLLDRLLVAAKGPVAVANAEQLATFAA